MQCFPDKEVKVVVEMLGVRKDKIKVDAYDNKAEVKGEDPQREYHRTIEIPLETAKSAYNNGILEITFSKKKQVRGKAIKVEEPLTSFIAS
ncbi:MAG: Hsp20 family protein [Candidatus Nitrosopolaris sp.]